ncbi:MAG: SpoIID/LytB domain-containing protein, partial [Phycisphaerales bacterium]|nr:SpoIID/LytB domain-containing protein [Phycisphaerales bacterium]
MNTSIDAARTALRRPRATPGVALCALLAIALAALGASGCQNSPKAAPSISRAAGPEPDVRIRVGSTHDRASFGSPATIEIDAGTFSRGWVRVQTPVTVRLSDDVWVITERSGATRRFGSVRPLKVRAADGMSVSVDGGTYAGQIELIARPAVSAGAFDVIAHVPMEKYLPGVLAKELYSDWTKGAYEAQAIAARSYAMHERNRRMAQGHDYDLETTEMDQVYGGDTTNRTALAAVETTRGQVLMFRGFPLRTYYSSTCGGRPNS